MNRNLRLAWLCALLFLFICGQAQEKILKEGTYPDGKIRYRGYFVGDQPVEKMTRYYPDGKLQAELTYNGRETDAILYSKDGSFYSAGKYVDKKKEGEWLYRKDERLIAKENYKRNRLDGVAVKYYISGKEAETKGWKEGKPSGEWNVYYDNGKRKLEAAFTDGKLEGPVKSYNYEGNLIAEGEYKQNLKEGSWRYYDGKGNFVREEKYIGGVSDREQEAEWDESKQIDALVKAGTKIVDPADFVNEPDIYLKITEE